VVVKSFHQELMVEDGSSTMAKDAKRNNIKLSISAQQQYSSL